MQLPQYCQYTHGPCDQDMSRIAPFKGFFAYPSEPHLIAKTVLQAVKQLQEHSSPQTWRSWEHLRSAGQIIFCDICKHMRAAEFVVANITTLNFNVLFELGYAIGLGKPVVPVRDDSYVRDREVLAEIGLFDNLRSLNFQNSNDLASIVMRHDSAYTFAVRDAEINKQAPIYLVRSPVDTDAGIRLLSCLKKSYFRFRTFDPRETMRLSLHEAAKQIRGSLAVVAHLIDPERSGALAHNGRAAFVCGMAMASGKHVLALQEGRVVQPIDYRDVVVDFDDEVIIPHFVEEIVRGVAERLQAVPGIHKVVELGILEKLDLGDLAAENEILGLATYFVKTPQYLQTRQGRARLVVGRKGSGKSAVFYAVRSAVQRARDVLVVDLKPEGHQFTKLRETVLQRLSEGTQLHTLTAFWNYLLLLEIAHRILHVEKQQAYRDPDSLKEYTELQRAYTDHCPSNEGDFSERLMALVGRIVGRFPASGSQVLRTPEVTRLIYDSDAHRLEELVIRFLVRKREVWLLFDNLDKGWPIRGLTGADVAILRCLLDATRKLQRDLERHEVEFRSAVFLRRDVYDLLVDSTPDRGKESIANLDWSDIELLKKLLAARIQASIDLPGEFDELWQILFDAHVNGQNSFQYMIERTFQRPRDLLNFARKAVQIAVSRGHSRVEQEDILSAEAAHSEDMLNDLRFEMRDVYPMHPNLVHAFLRAEPRMSREEIDLRLSEASVPDARLDEVVDMLLWFSFLGVVSGPDERYAYQYLYDLPKLKSLLREYGASAEVYSIHPGLRASLGSA